MAEFVGRKIRRSVYENHDEKNVECGYYIAIIREWIPADGSDIISEETGASVDVWRVKPVEYCVYEICGNSEYAVRLNCNPLYYLLQVLR
jgi:hypothetical protein